VRCVVSMLMRLQFCIKVEVTITGSTVESWGHAKTERKRSKQAQPTLYCTSGRQEGGAAQRMIRPSYPCSNPNE
jgi:hypothetical protein